MAWKARGVAGCLVLMAAAGAAAPAMGQAARGEPARASGAAMSLAERALPDALARLAIFDLRATQRPSDTDYRIAALLLGMAREQRPGDTDLLRRQIEAAWSAGDQAQVLELTRELLRLDSEDTVAQLRLITASIAQNNQTAEERLASYEKFLGPQGKQFAPEIRSRLALDAALLLRERGDLRGFAEKLTQAMNLDPTHKEAAALAVTFFAEREPEDRAGLLNLLQNLLMADPVDPNVHLAIARELAAGGAYKGAERFYRNAILIMQVGGSAPDQDVEAQAAALQWHTGGARALLDGIRKQLMLQRSEAAKLLRRFEGGQVPQGLMRPEDVLLPAPTALLTVAAAESTGDRDAVRASLDELKRSINASLTALRDPEQRARYPEEVLTRAMAQAALQVQIARLWGDIETDLVAPDLDQNPEIERALPQEAAAVRGWATLRGGDAAGAIAALEPAAAESLFARIGLGLAHEKAGKMEEAIETYRWTVREAPLSQYGAWAHDRLNLLGMTEDIAGVAQLERAAAKIPAWIDRMVGNAREFVQMTITPAERAPGAVVSNPLRITIQNLATVPLALGSDRALNSRVLLSPQIESQTPGLNRLSRPEVVDLDRRLRLKPRERLEVTVNPDVGLTGWMLEAVGNRSLRLRWRGTQGFVMTRSGIMQPGVMCVVADAESTMRRPLDQASLALEDYARTVLGGTPQEAPGLAAAMRATFLQPLIVPTQAEAALDPQQRAQADEARKQAAAMLAEVWAKRYPELSPEIRAAVAALIPHATLAPGLESLDEVIRQEEHPLPLAVVLTTRVKDPGDEVLARASGSPDERIRQLALMVAERLGGEEMVYARLTPERLRAEQEAGGGQNNQQGEAQGAAR